LPAAFVCDSSETAVTSELLRLVSKNTQRDTSQRQGAPPHSRCTGPCCVERNHIGSAANKAIVKSAAGSWERRDTSSSSTLPSAVKSGAVAGRRLSMTTAAQRDEVSRILALTKDDPKEAYGVVERQLSVLVLRTQVMLSLSGIVITVTGFSGRAIAQTNDLARVLVSLGILVVLAAAATGIGGVLRLRWLTQELTDDTRETLTRMLGIRDTKSKFLSAALVLFLVGFSCYCVAIAQMLIHVTPTG
jgi:hypothetical protein